MHNIKDMTMLLGLNGEWVGTPDLIFDGHLFALLLVPSLEEDELEEVIVDRLETAIEQDAIRFSANRERAISNRSLPHPSPSFPILPHPSPSFPILPHPSPSFPILPHPSLSFTILPYPSLSFHFSHSCLL
jgi:hypothetical protein